MRRSPQQLPEFEEHACDSPRAFVVAGPAALRMSQEERDKADANERRREARLWRERQQLLRDEEAERSRRELQEQQRRRVQLEDEGRSKLFDTVAAGSMVGMPSVGVGAGDSADSVLRASSDDGEGDSDGPEERSTPSPEVVRQRIAGRRQLAEAREFAAMGPSMVSAAIAQFEAGLGQLMPLLRGGGPPDPTLRDEVMQAVDAIEQLRRTVRAKQPTQSRPPPDSGAGASGSGPGASEAAATAGRSGPVPARRPRRSEPHTHTVPSAPSPTTYSGDGMSQPWVSSFKSGALSSPAAAAPAGAAPAHGSGRQQAPGRETAALGLQSTPAALLASPRDGGGKLDFGESLDSLLEFVQDLHPSPVRLSRPTVVDGARSSPRAAIAAPAATRDSPIRLPASPRESEKTAVEQRAEGLRQSIVALYQRVNPGALTELPGVFKRYRGREPELWSTVCRKYGHDPTDDLSLRAAPAPTLAAGNYSGGTVVPGETVVPGDDPTQQGQQVQGQSETRRSMALEHADVAPPPSPELRNWVPPVPAPGDVVPMPAAVVSPRSSSSGTQEQEREQRERMGAMQKINVRLSREVPTGATGDTGIGIESLQQDDSLVGGGGAVAAVEIDNQQSLLPPESGNSMILGASMARWMSREATTVNDSEDKAAGVGAARSTATGVGAAAAVDTGEMSVAEAAAAAARRPAVPASPIQLPSSPAGSGGASLMGAYSPSTAAQQQQQQQQQQQ